MTYHGRIAALSTAWPVSAASIRHVPDVADATVANVGTVLACRTEPRDPRQLEEWFAFSVTVHELTTLADHARVARMAKAAKLIDPFSFEALGRPCGMQAYCTGR